MVRNILVIKSLGFAEIYTFLTSAPMVSVLEERHIMQCQHRCDVICDICDHCKTFCYTSKLYYNKKKILIFVIYMTFISIRNS